MNKGLGERMNGKMSDKRVNDKRVNNISGRDMFERIGNTKINTKFITKVKMKLRLKTPVKAYLICDWLTDGELLELCGVLNRERNIIYIPNDEGEMTTKKLNECKGEYNDWQVHREDINTGNSIIMKVVVKWNSWTKEFYFGKNMVYIRLKGQIIPLSLFQQWNYILGMEVSNTATSKTFNKAVGDIMIYKTFCAYYIPYDKIFWGSEMTVSELSDKDRRELKNAVKSGWWIKIFDEWYPITDKEIEEEWIEICEEGKRKNNYRESALNIANWVLCKYAITEGRFSTVDLNNLLFIIQGYCMAADKEKRPVFTDEIKAHSQGTLVSDVWRRYDNNLYNRIIIHGWEDTILNRTIILPDEKLKQIYEVTNWYLMKFRGILDRANMVKAQLPYQNAIEREEKVITIEDIREWVAGMEVFE